MKKYYLKVRSTREAEFEVMAETMEEAHSKFRNGYDNAIVRMWSEPEQQILDVRILPEGDD